MKLFAHIVNFLGIVVWTYGYFAIGHAALVDWQKIAPMWIAEFLPNVEAEIGLVLMLVGSVFVYWPSKRRSPGTVRP